MQDNGQLIHFRIAFTSTFFLLVDTIIINIIFGQPLRTRSLARFLGCVG
jgi:hypothetical protein